LKAFKRLYARLGEKAWQHIPEFHGTVDTDLGLGLVTDFVRSSNGSAGVNLTRYFPDDFTDPIKRAVRSLTEWILEVPLVPRDFGVYNVVICQTAEAAYHAWLVDGFGSAEFIPLSEYNNRHGQRIAQRRVDRFEKKVQRYLSLPSEKVQCYPITLDR